MTLAFSYIRFSSEKQTLGDSVRRQLEKAQRYSQLHGLTLDHTTYRDLGVSAFHGKNAAEGKLGTFLEAIEKGLIPRGSTLLIEDFDRLSRNEIDDALILFLRIIRAGVTIVTLKDEQVYTQERIRNDSASLIVSIMYMGRAHDESAMKSDRVKRAWGQKRISGFIMTAMAPSWLSPNADRKTWKIDKAKATVVEHIFDLALAGNGTPSIARQLNESRIPTMKSAVQWTFGTVAAILKNRAVIGQYTPKKAVADPIVGYYPAIIDANKFALVQESMAKRKWIGGRSRENVANLFAGISYCQDCGAKMRIVGTSGRHTYLRCLTAYSNGGCKEGRFPYVAAERAILRHLADDLSILVANLDDTSTHETSVTLRDQRNEFTRKIGNLIDSLADTKSPLLVERINSLQLQIDEIDDRLTSDVAPITRKAALADIGETFETLKWKAGNDIPVELRLKLQVEIQRIIQAVYFLSDAENKRPTVALTYVIELGGHTKFFDVRPYMEKVGGNRSAKKS